MDGFEAFIKVPSLGKKWGGFGRINCLFRRKGYGFFNEEIRYRGKLPKLGY
jgi:hypothetical protein